MNENNNVIRKPVFNIPMDELRDKTIVNLAEFPNSPLRKISMLGEPQVYYDYFMGTSIAFKGAEATEKQEFTLASATGFSAELWFNANVLKNSSQRLLSLDISLPGDTGDTFYIDLESDEEKMWLKVCAIRGNEDLFSTEIIADRWVHVALVAGANKYVKCYVDNKQLEPIMELPNWNVQQLHKSSLVIGASDYDAYFFNGKLCQFKLYNDVLSEADIDLSFDKGKNANATFKSTYPIDFTLNTVDNGNELPVLYIGDGTTAHELKLGIINVSGTHMRFENIPQISVSNYHFQLRFKKQVLDNKTIIELSNHSKLGDNWTYLVGSDTEFLEDWISFTCSGIDVFSGLLNILLSNVQAAAATGARNTVVEIKYNNIKYKDSADILSGSLTRHLDIISYGGKILQPFDAGIKGAAEILKSEAGEFKISITNITGKAINFTPAGNNRVSKFIVSLKEPAKGVPNAVFEKNKFSPRTVAQLGNWKQPFECNQEYTKLDENGSLVIEISNFQLERAYGGIVTLYIDYQNIPGYADGYLTVSVNLSKQVDHDARAGIKQAEQNTDVSLYVDGRVMDQTGYLMPIGAIIAYGGNNAPAGWLLCDGQPILNDSKYSALKNVLGNEGRTPDLRARFIVGVDNSRPEYKLRVAKGEERVTLGENEMPDHSHDVKEDSANIFNGNSGNLVLMPEGSYNNYVSSGGITVLDRAAKEGVLLKNAIIQHHSHNVRINRAGGGGSHNNLPPYYALTYIIKY
ncbi:LamG-like jellyroll fold domain-containing protein [Mucilaginibacter jinjuensis]|uniref:Tail fiber protein n=1 Tax=Mucilaginibacter jinjuensis TaxID=1176721 RepID=A0ABY7T443_9SPHI|nr:LamG-like jellyroll fold domain-containing protein [Mucilaginibacter jinjuensis]WCT10482.1 tail fiber protein [Mucilaginibacter jinjuensis]